MAGRVVLETPRLILREFDLDDAAAFFIMGSDPAIIRYTGDPGLRDIEHARESMLARPMADYQKYGYGRWACVLRETGAVIGFVGLKFLDDLQEVDLGYRLMPEFWGRGLATEASRPTLDYGFDVLRLKEIIALVEPENTASVRIMDKLGMRFTGQIDYRGTVVNRYLLRAEERSAKSDGH